MDAYLLQIIREGGPAAGGALFVGSLLVGFILSGKLVTVGQYQDMRKQRDAALRELRAERRAHRNTVESYKSSVMPSKEQ